MKSEKTLRKIDDYGILLILYALAKANEIGIVYLVLLFVQSDIRGENLKGHRR
jgi:hypothetical protein